MRSKRYKANLKLTFKDPHLHNLQTLQIKSNLKNKIVALLNKITCQQLVLEL